MGYNLDRPAAAEMAGGPPHASITLEFRQGRRLVMKIPVEVLKQCWFLSGPTASGKSAAALALARRLGAEILSMDSMAVYRRMDIGTAKPSAEEQAAIPHHLIDLVDPHQEYSLAEYAQAADAAARAVLERGRIPLFVGGTGLYLRTLLRGLFDGPPACPDLRRRLQEQIDRSGAESLHRRLMEIDPVTAARVHVNDHRRIIRAVEVFECTGRPLSEQQHQGPRPVHERPRSVVWLCPPRSWLRNRIDLRVTAMMRAGLLEETRRILASDRPPGKTARQALGYRELIAHLESRVSLDKAVDTIRLRTKQFAKRQFTWFRSLDECLCLPIDGSESPEELAARIVRESEQS